MIETTFEKTAYRELLIKAVEALDYSYSPYSSFAVGAALLDSKGKIWTGANIESASYSPTNCGERTALFKAVSEGVREFSALAVVGRKEGEETLAQDYAAPCGVCRQMLMEFCSPSMPIILMKKDGKVQEWTLGELLPFSFTKKNLG